MNIEQRVRAALRDLADAVPVAPPPAGTVRTRADSPPSRASGRWLAPALAAGAVIAVLAAVAVAPGWLTLPGPTGTGDGSVERPSLPERFADWTSRTATVADAPPGPVIAVYRHGTADTVNLPVLVAADGRTYRHLGDPYSRMTNAGGDPLLLAPDGTRLAGGGGSLLDLTTGQLTIRPVLPGDALSSWQPTVPLAWSRDGRWLAYGRIEAGRVPVVPDRPGDRTGLALLDLVTGRVGVMNTGDGLYQQVAFSPDGTELAVSLEVDGEDRARTVVRVFNRSGTLLRELEPPTGHLLTPYGTAWSPDGTLLVVQDPQRPQRFTFLDATGTGTAVPAPVTVEHPGGVELVGWQSTDTLLVAADRDTGSLGWLIEVPVAGGAARVVDEFPDGEHDRIADLRLAAGLLAVAEIRDTGSPQHGPLPPEQRIGLTVIVAAVVLGGLGAWWLRVRDRRPPGAGRRTIRR